MSRWLCKDFLRWTCNNSFCEQWHPPECLFYKTKSGCPFQKKCSYAHRQVDEQPTKRSKKNDDKSEVAILKKGDRQERGPVTDQCYDRSEKPGKRSDKKLGQNSSKRQSSDARQLGCVFQDMTPPKSILRKGTDMPKTIQRVKFTKAIARRTKIRDQNPSIGYICPGEPHERSPNTPKFEDRSQEETEWQEQGAREAAWKLAKNVLKLKEHERATFFSPSENRCLPASTLKPEEREFVVDSGASMHMISKKDLSNAEMDTLTKSCSPTIVITAIGPQNQQVYGGQVFKIPKKRLIFQLIPRQDVKDSLLKRTSRVSDVLRIVKAHEGIEESCNPQTRPGGEMRSFTEVNTYRGEWRAEGWWNTSTASFALELKVGLGPKHSRQKNHRMGNKDDESSISLQKWKKKRHGLTITRELAAGKTWVNMKWSPKVWEDPWMDLWRNTQWGGQYIEARFQMEKHDMVAVHPSIRNEKRPVQPHKVENRWWWHNRWANERAGKVDWTRRRNINHLKTRKFVTSALSVNLSTIHRRQSTKDPGARIKSSARVKKVRQGSNVETVRWHGSGSIASILWDRSTEEKLDQFKKTHGKNGKSQITSRR